MSEPVVEIAYLPLVPGTDLSTGEGKRVLEDTLKTLLEQPGCTAVYHGRQVEHPDMYQLAIGQCTRFEASYTLPKHPLGSNVCQIHASPACDPKMLFDLD